MLEKTGGAINYGQSRDIDNIEHDTKLRRTKRKLQAHEPKKMSNTHFTKKIWDKTSAGMFE
jgi:hypothetical protein